MLLIVLKTFRHRGDDLKINRQKKILNILDSKEYSSVNDLAKELEVSNMTIRRDLEELQTKNKLIKEHGGARRINKILSTNEKMTINVPQKQNMGKVMNSLIKPEDVIFIGAGTTFYYALNYLSVSYKSIITNSIVSFNWLLDHNYKNIFLTGGELFDKTGEFFGEHAESLLDSFNIDIAFIATNGIYNQNITTSKPSLGRLQNKAIITSKKSFVLADSSKLDVADTFTFATTNEISGIITDSNISDDLLRKYKSLTNIYY